MTNENGDAAGSALDRSSEAPHGFLDALLITSRANPLVKRMRALQRRSERARQGVLIVEGILPVWRAVESGAAIETLIVAPNLLRSAAAIDMVAAQARSGMRVASVSGPIFEQFAWHENPSGLAAIVQIPQYSLADIKISREAIVTVLIEPGNPGNVGTIVRTVVATGGTGLIVVGRATDPFHPTSVKASMGTLFALRIVQIDLWETVRDWAAAQRLPIITTSAHAEQAYWDAELPVPSMIVLGSEAEGLSRAILADGTRAVRIPMAGSGSLNLAVASAILLYEIQRRRKGAGG